MSSGRRISIYQDLLQRMSKEFLTERVGIEPTAQEVAELAAHIRRLNAKHKQRNQQREPMSL